MKRLKTLKKNYEFETVIKKGKFFIGKQITVYIYKNKENFNKFGIAISSKTCNAVMRNRIKRKIRENYRNIREDLDSGYSIVFLWNKKVLPAEVDYNVIRKDMFTCFKKVGILK